MSAAHDQLLREGVAAIRHGDLAAARDLLAQIVEADPFNTQAWLWLSAAVESDDDRIICLENVLTIDPHHEAARRGLTRLGVEPPPAPPEPAAPPPPQTVYHAAPDAVDGPLQATLMGEKPEKSPRSRGGDAPPAAPDDDREGWRAALYDTHYAGSSATLVPAYEPPPQTTFRDLVRVWGDLFILNPHGGLDTELKHGGLGHTVINLGAAGLLQIIASGLLVGVMVALAAAGIQPPLETSVERLLNQPVEADLSDVGAMGEALRALGMDLTVEGPGVSSGEAAGLLGASGLLIALQAVLSIPAMAFGILVYALVTNALTVWLLAGKGDAMQTFHGLTLALVVGQAAQIPVVVFTPLLPFGAALMLAALVRIYQLAASAVALNAVHRVGVLPAVGALIMGSAATGAVVGGFCFGLTFLVTLVG